MPEEISIESCNTTFFTLNDKNTKCGLCKDISDTKPYKIVEANELTINICIF